jgi:hypothetical protein
MGLSALDIAGDVLVYHYSAESLCGEIDTDEIDIEWSARRNFRSMDAAELEYFGLEATEDQQAVRFEIDFARSVVLETPTGTNLGEVMDSLSFDWHVEGADSETELVSVHWEILER